ncbi:MAG: hypothetical protein QOD99_897 [Chthoniobacter sp.]|nr:hypothetical protein [Chthoniobacter sp.]
MKLRLLSLALILPLLASGEPPKTTEERLHGELREIQQVRETLDQRERAVTARIEEIQAGRDTTNGISNVCPVHNSQMRIVRAPITYGVPLVRPGDPPPDVRSREFPFALEYWPGGCVVGDYTRAKIYVCPVCQRAEKQWKKTHNR